MPGMDRNTQPRTSPRKDGPTRAAVRAMLATGMSTREMSMALGITTQAVSKHVAAIRRSA